MTKQDFEKIEPQLQEAFEKAILKAAQECPQGFMEWLGMSNTSPENPADEEYMKTISGGVTQSGQSSCFARSRASVRIRPLPPYNAPLAHLEEHLHA